MSKEVKILFALHKLLRNSCRELCIGSACCCDSNGGTDANLMSLMAAEQPVIHYGVVDEFADIVDKYNDTAAAGARATVVGTAGAVPVAVADAVRVGILAPAGGRS